MDAQSISDVIPVNEPLIGRRERDYVLDCVESGWISSEGEYVRRFEDYWAAYCGRAHAVGVSSGTAALCAAVAAAGLGPGDEVIVPTFTIIGCAHAIRAVGAVPVLVDSDPQTWCMDSDQVASRITEKTRAIMPVHIYGHPVDMDPLQELGDSHSLSIIEDAAEAHGATYRGTPAGALGDLGCFSFYANKIVTTGEGGMVVTDDADLATRVRSYINMGFRADRRFFHTDIGFNHRLTSLQAAVGLAQAEEIEGRVRRKREIGAAYTRGLENVPGIITPVEKPWATNVYWMYGIVLSDQLGIDASEFAGRLRNRGVQTRPFFLGLHEQPVLRRQGLFGGERYPVAERLSMQGLYLPSGLTITDSQIDTVVAAVRGALEQ